MSFAPRSSTRSASLLGTGHNRAPQGSRGRPLKPALQTPFRQTAVAQLTRVTVRSKAGRAAAGRRVLADARGDEQQQGATGGVANGSGGTEAGGPTVKVHWCSRGVPTDGWGLHVWGPAKEPTQWDAALQPSEQDDFGLVWTVPLKPWTIGQAGEPLGLLVHAGEEKDVEAAVPKHDLVALFDPASPGRLEVWLVSGIGQLFYEEPNVAALPVGDLSKARAHWVAKDIVAWRTATDNATFSLHCSSTASLKNSDGQMHNEEGPIIMLDPDPSGLPHHVLEKYPFLGGCACLRVPQGVDSEGMVQCQVAVSKSCAETSAMLDCTGVQLQGVLDDMYAYDGPLGSAVEGSEVAFAVWAPTSRSVELLLYSSQHGEASEVHGMQRGGDGVWRASVPASWQGCYYQYRLHNFSPTTGFMETCTAPDPYSRSLSADGIRTQIVDLRWPDLLPLGWDDCGHQKPPLAHHADAAIYELHVRDFSIFDHTVPPEHRGKYLAFEADSIGTRHLASLAEAGLTHVHLLPCYDFGTVPERAEHRAEADFEQLAAQPPASDAQQRMVMEVADRDGFNWGYDPVLFSVPEGSYATNGVVDGCFRTAEFRRMVAAINRLGLRVVLDVVYNHLFSSGPHSDKSVYDKIVPGYYLRRSEEGDVENSTCMNNTASENYMVDRLIVDDLVHWAVNYKVDGFRFDLMGHIMLKTLTRAREALDALTLEEHGVDGKKVIMYGEGWDFGEVAGCARGVNGGQFNLGGTGIGSFNDRIREPAVGGSPFADPRLQGFSTGLYLKPWPLNTPGIEQGDEAQQLEGLLYESDKIRLGLAGNLASFTIEDFRGQFVRGSTAHGGGIAYASEPCETINYVSAHDNETLFDMCVLKMPRELRSTEERIRASWLCTSLVALGNGIPFFHAGDEVLRSKSLDRDSYNSGDWFNRLDFTGDTHNLGVGLPPASKNQEKWPLMHPILSDPAMKPSGEQIRTSIEKFKELLRIRKSTALIGLRDAQQIMRQVRFPNTGPRQIPGLIVMEVVDKGWSGEAGDASSRFSELPNQTCDKFARVVVAFNARPEETTFGIDGAAALSLHPIMAHSMDTVVQSAAVDAEAGHIVAPPLSAVVFVEPRQ